jgi:tetratricopeptide (TPR) repeat protein
VAFLERALTLLDDGGDEALRFEVILSIGRACMRGGATERGRRACRDAAALARARGRAEDLGRVGLALGEHTIFAFIDPELTKLLQEALAALGDANPLLRARLLARLAAALQPALDPRGPMDLAREAVLLARRSGDARTRLEVLFAAGSALGYFAEPTERLPLDLELTEIARVLGDQVKLARGLVRVCIDHWELGDRNAAVATAAEHRRVAETLGLASHLRTAILLGNIDAIMSGRFDEAANAIARAEAIPTTIEPGVRVPIAGQALALAFARTDGAAAARADGPMREALGTTFDRFYTLAIATRVDVMLGRTDALRRGLQECRLHLEALRHRPMVAFLADGVAEQGDIVLADAFYDIVAPYRHRNHGWGIGLMVLEGPFTEVLGVLAQAGGHLPKAIEDFEDALTRAEAMGARPHSARIGVRLAEALEARGAPADVARADELRRWARSTAEALGMPGLLAKLQAAPTRSTSIDFRLVREGDVWRVRVGTTEHVLKHFRGLEILAELVAHPGEERHVFDLLGVEFDGGDAGPALDARAIASYKTRVKELQQDIDEAENEGRSEVAAHLQDERDAIARELSRGTGMGGRPRMEKAAIERARVNVRRRIVLAIEQIASVAPELARHLESSVQTGIHCVYRPAP